MSSSSSGAESVLLRIGDLAARTGVSPRSLRYYETQELLLAERTTGGQRLYDESAVDRVELIQRLFRAGLGSTEVVRLLPCVYSGTTTPAMVGLLRAQRDRIDEQVTELSATRDRLDGVIVEAERRMR